MALSPQDEERLALEEERLRLENENLQLELQKARAPQEVSPDILTRPESIPARLLAPEPIVSAASRQFSVPPQKVSTEPMVGLQRFGVGASADTPEEELAYYRKFGPPAEYQLVTHPSTGEKYVAGRREDGSVFFPNRPGWDWGDATQFLGQETAPSAAATGAASASGVYAPITAPLAYGGTKLVQEGIQRFLLGTGRENPKQALSRVGDETAWALGGEGLGIAAQKAAQVARGLAGRIPPTTRRAVAAIEAGRREGLSLGPIKPWQLVDSPMIGSAARQQEQALGGGVERSVAQRGDLVANDLPRLNFQGAKGPEKSFVNEAERQFEEVYKDVPLMRDYEAAGHNANRAFRDVYSKSNKELRSAYRKADAAQELEHPVFDASAAQDEVRSLGVFAEGKDKEAIEEAIAGLKGRPLDVKEVNKLVNVGEPAGKVRRAATLLNSISPEQTDYRVIQRLRTIVGGAIKTFKSSTGDNLTSGQAKRVWDALTDVLKNPKNKADTPQFLAAFEDATAKARQQFEWLANDRVKSALKKEKQPYQLFQEIANNPATMNPDARAIVDRFSPGRAAVLKQNILGEIFSRPGSGSLEGKLAEMERRSPGLTTWLTGSPYQTELLTKQARTIDTLKSSGWDDIYKKKLASLDQRQALMEAEATDLKSSKAFAKKMPGASRQTVGAHLYDGVVVPDEKTGMFTIDYKRYLRNKKTATEKGWWDGILTPRDRTRLDAVESYLRVTQAAPDVGARMSTGSLGGKFSDPDAWIELATKLIGQRSVGFFLTSDKLGDRVYRKILKGSGRKTLQLGTVLGLISGAMIGSLSSEAVPAAERLWSTPETQ